MATNLENNLKMPVLWEIAILGGNKIEFYNGRDDRDQQAMVVDSLADLYHLTERERNDCYPRSGKKEFKSEVRYSMVELRKEGALDHIRRRSWQVTEKGLKQLRAFCACMLRHLPPSEAQQFLASQDENGQDFFLNAIKCLPAQELSNLSQAASSYLDLFARAVEHIPLSKLSGFLSSVHHRREVLLARHIAGYRGSAREPCESMEAANRLVRVARQ